MQDAEKESNYFLRVWPERFLGQDIIIPVTWKELTLERAFQEEGALIECLLCARLCTYNLALPKERSGLVPDSWKVVFEPLKSPEWCVFHICGGHLKPHLSILGG